MFFFICLMSCVFEFYLVYIFVVCIWFNLNLVNDFCIKNEMKKYFNILFYEEMCYLFFKGKNFFVNLGWFCMLFIVF